MQDFGSLKLLVALLGPSWRLLGPIWSQNGPQNGPKSRPKSAQQLVQKMDPTITPNMPVLGPKMAPKMNSKISALLDASLLGQSSGARWPQDGAKMVQDAFWRGFGGGLEGFWRGFGGGLEASKHHPKPLQTPSKPPPNPFTLLHLIQTPSKTPRCLQDVPRCSQDGPRWCQDASQMSQDAPQDAIPLPSTQTSHGSNGVLPPF